MALRHSWDVHTHLERIANGIDTVPGVIKNEFSCCDVNTNDLSRAALAQIRFDPSPLPSTYICVFLALQLTCLRSGMLPVGAESIIANRPADCQKDSLVKARRSLNTCLKLSLYQNLKSKRLHYYSPMEA